jgi:hypothetical protein
MRRRRAVVLLMVLTSWMAASVIAADDREADHTECTPGTHVRARRNTET